MTAPDKILQEVAALRREINYHNRLYYTLDSPEIPDADYDALFDRLTELEQEYDLVLPNLRLGGSGQSPLCSSPRSPMSSQCSRWPRFLMSRTFRI